MKSYSAARMRALDRRTIEEYGIPGTTLMENAGTALTRAVLRFSAGFDSPEFVILAGKGNNGGDAFVTARQLHQSGRPVHLFMTARPDELTGDAAEMFEAMPQALKNGARFEFSADDIPEQAVIIDGLLGTGIRGEVREPSALLRGFRFRESAEKCGNRPQAGSASSMPPTHRLSPSTSRPG